MGVYEGGGGYYCLHGCVYEVGLLMPGCVRGGGGGVIDAWVCTRGVY